MKSIWNRQQSTNEVAFAICFGRSNFSESLYTLSSSVLVVCMYYLNFFDSIRDFLSAHKQTPDFKTHKKALTKESGFELNNKKSHFLVVERAELYSKGQKKALMVPNLRKFPKHSCHIRDLVPFYLPYIQIFKLKMGKKGKYEVKIKQIEYLDSM